MTTLYDLVNKNEKYIEILEKILAYEKDRITPEEREKGWLWTQVKVKSQELNVLVTDVYPSVLEIIGRAGKSHRYRLAIPRVSVENLLIYMKRKALMPKVPEGFKLGPARNTGKPLKPTIHTFDDILGFGDLKRQIVRSFENEPLHYVFWGPPACAKSMFLDSLDSLEGAKYLVGGTAKAAGILKVLFEYQPRILLFDEIEKCDREDLAVILSLMESGRVTEAKSTGGRIREIWLKETRVFAAGNRYDRIPPENRSRFREVHMKPYTIEDIQKIVINMGRKFGVDEYVARYLSQKLAEIGSVDPRDAKQCYRMKIKSRSDVDEQVNFLRRYSKPQAIV